MKKTAITALAAVLAVAIFATVVSVGEEAPPLQVVIETVSAEAGETVSVRIILDGVGSGGPENIASVLAAVSWSDKLTLTDAVYNCDLTSQGAAKSKTLSHTPKKTKYVFVNGVPAIVTDWSEVQSPYTFNWLAFSSSDAVKADCTFVTLTFKVAADAEGTLPITAEIDPENLFDDNENNVRFEITNGAVVIGGTAPGLLGDANGDGTVNGVDLVRLRKYLNYYNADTGTSLYNVTELADCNGDNVINGRDLIRLRKMLNGSGTGAAELPDGSLLRRNVTDLPDQNEF